MDILDRLLGHDAWTTRQLLLRSQGLSDEQLDRCFAIGHESLRATFGHMIWNMEAWTDLISQRPIRARSGPRVSTIPQLVDRLDAVAVELAAVARRIRDEGKLDECFADTAEDLQKMKTLGGAISYVITHSMHHRAQVLNIMRHLGISDLIEGDVLEWERVHRAGEGSLPEAS